MEYVLGAVAGLAVGAVAAYLIASARAAAAREREHSELRSEADTSKNLFEDARGQLAGKEEEITRLREKLQEESTLRTSSETRLEEERKNLKEQRELMEEAKKKLSETFDLLARKALDTSNEEFLKRAGERLKPIKESLDKYEKHVLAMEKSLKVDYGSLDEQLKSMKKAEKELIEKTVNLDQALRQPLVRGDWGELTLRRVIELAGMVEHCDFEVQKSSKTKDKKSGIPDCIIKLPGNRVILIDSKAPRADYMRAVEATSENEKEAALKEHAKKVRRHVKDLSGKEYIRQFDFTPEYVLMFLPMESVFSAALQYDKNLVEDALKLNIIIASPTTLLALLRALALAWQQSKMAENAKKIADEGRKLFERVQTFGTHFIDIGSSLEKARDAFNSAVGSWNRSVRPSGSRLVKLGTGPASSEMEEIRMIEKPIREIPADFKEEE